jgi:hypothetical protein
VVLLELGLWRTASSVKEQAQAEILRWKKTTLSSFLMPFCDMCLAILKDLGDNVSFGPHHEYHDDLKY